MRLTDHELAFLYHRAVNILEYPTPLYPSQGKEPTAWCNAYDPVGEMLLASMLPRVEELTEQTLFPTYANFLLYRKSPTPSPTHVDRLACHTTVSFTIHAEDINNVSPLFIEDTPVILPPGYGTIFQGHSTYHHRGPVEYNRHYQLLLHYVPTTYPNERFDGRARLGWPGYTRIKHCG